jgi:hypothetical protein
MEQSSKLTRSTLSILRATTGIVLFCSSVLLSAAELTPINGVLPGLLASMSFGASVAAAPFIHYQKIQSVRPLVVPLAATAGTLTIARWPAFFTDNPAASQSVQVLAILGLAWMLAKLLLLQRFSTMYCARAEFSDNELSRLLPVQEECLDRLRGAIFSGPIEQGSRES